MHDANIHIFQVLYKIGGDQVGLLKKGFMHMTGRGGIVMPCDVPSIQGIGDFDPFNVLAQKDSGSFTVRAGFTDQNFDGNMGIQQHFDLICDNIHQRVCGGQAGKHGQYGNFHTADTISLL